MGEGKHSTDDQKQESILLLSDQIHIKNQSEIQGPHWTRNTVFTWTISEWLGLWNHSSCKTKDSCLRYFPYPRNPPGVTCIYLRMGSPWTWSILTMIGLSLDCIPQAILMLRSDETEGNVWSRADVFETFPFKGNKYRGIFFSIFLWMTWKGKTSRFSRNTKLLWEVDWR